MPFYRFLHAAVGQVRRGRKLATDIVEVLVGSFSDWLRLGDRSSPGLRTDRQHLSIPGRLRSGFNQPDSQHGLEQRHDPLCGQFRRLHAVSHV